MDNKLVKKVAFDDNTINLFIDKNGGFIIEQEMNDTGVKQSISIKALEMASLLKALNIE